DECFGIARVGRRPSEAANGFVEAHGYAHAVRRIWTRPGYLRRGPGASTSADSLGITQQPSRQTSGVPRPPYWGASLDRPTGQSVRSGGASKGSAIDGRSMSAP